MNDRYRRGAIHCGKCRTYLGRGRTLGGFDSFSGCCSPCRMAVAKQSVAREIRKTREARLEEMHEELQALREEHEALTEEVRKRKKKRESAAAKQIRKQQAEAWDMLLAAFKGGDQPAKSTKVKIGPLQFERTED